MLIFTNLIVFVPYLTISPDKNLLPQIKTISENFQESDLILVDRDATGDGWSMMTGPLNFLFNKQAVYFFNSKDLSQIDRDKFTAIYFIIPDTKLDFYRSNGILEKLTPVKDYSIATEILAIKTGGKQEMFTTSIELPSMQNSTIYGKIYLLTD